MTISSEDAVIDCRGLWKIFGKRADEAMKAVQEQGLGKIEVRDGTVRVNLLEAGRANL